MLLEVFLSRIPVYLIHLISPFPFLFFVDSFYFDVLSYIVNLFFHAC